MKEYVMVFAVDGWWDQKSEFCEFKFKPEQNWKVSFGYEFKGKSTFNNKFPNFKIYEEIKKLGDRDYDSECYPVGEIEWDN